MGNKCAHCTTLNGNMKYVCDRLQNLGGGCGKCQGVISENDKRFMLEHYKMRLEQLEQEKISLENLIEKTRNLAEEVRSARSVIL